MVAVSQVEFQSENTSERIILSLCVRRERPLGVAALRIRLGISPTNNCEDPGSNSERAESERLATISSTFKCNGIMFASTRAASVQVDLNKRPMIKANGRWADLRDLTIFFLLVAEAHTEQLYSIVGMKEDLYKSDTVHGTDPKKGDNISRFEIIIF